MKGCDNTDSIYFYSHSARRLTAVAVNRRNALYLASLVLICLKRSTDTYKLSSRYYFLEVDGGFIFVKSKCFEISFFKIT